MKKTIILAVLSGSALLATPAVAQMGMGRGMLGMGGAGMKGGGPEGVSTVRHRYVMTHGIDTAYAKTTNPLPASTANLKAGKTLFEQNCMICHGATGHGDGPAAKGLNPAPADLNAALRMPIASDAYLNWTISEGGVPVHSAMPPFKSALSKDQIWKLMTYLRTL